MKMNRLEKTTAGILIAGVYIGMGIYLRGLLQTDPNGPWYDTLKNPYVQIGLGIAGAAIASAVTWGIGLEIRNLREYNGSQPNRNL